MLYEWALEATVEPQVEPLSLTEAKAHLRVEVSTDDDLITSLIKVARQYAEAVTGRQLSVATLRLTLDEFPSENDEQITLLRPPVHYISSISYVDTDGVTQTVDSSDYQLDRATEPARLRPAYGTSWPSARDQMAAVTIDYVAGYVTQFTVDASTDVLTWSGRTPVDGEAVVLSNSGGTLPGGLATLTTYYVRDVSGSTCKLAASSGGAAIDITDTGTGTHFIGSVPPPILAAMKLLIGHLYENREATSEAKLTSVPLAVAALLAPWRVNWESI